MRAASSASAVALGEHSADDTRLKRLEAQAAFEPLLLRAAEVATILRLGRSTIYQLLGSGVLPQIRIGRAVRVPRAGLEEWVRKQSAAADGEGQS